MENSSTAPASKKLIVCGDIRSESPDLASQAACLPHPSRVLLSLPSHQLHLCKPYFPELLPTTPIPLGPPSSHRTPQAGCGPSSCLCYSVSVCSGHRNKAPQTRWLTQQKFLTVLEAGSPRAGRQTVQFLLGTLLLACRWLPSCYVLTWPFFVGVPKDRESPLFLLL